MKGLVMTVHLTEAGLLTSLFMQLGGFLSPGCLSGGKGSIIKNESAEHSDCKTWRKNHTFSLRFDNRLNFLQKSLHQASGKSMYVWDKMMEIGDALS